MSAKRFHIGETDRVEVVRPESITEDSTVSLDGGEPMDAQDAIDLAIDLLLAAGADDAAGAVVDHVIADLSDDDLAGSDGNTEAPA